MPLNFDQSRALQKRAVQFIPGGVNSPVRAFRSVGGDPPFLVRGEGPYVWDADGNQYIDYVGSWGPLILGHAVPDVIDAIVYAARDRTLGIGAGQMSRIDSLKLAWMKLNQQQPLILGSQLPLVMASDAFFPFRDCVDEASKLGISAIIQPGGSIRDEDSIRAANDYGMAMVFTGMRHFRH